MTEDIFSPINVTIKRSKEITEHVPEDVSRAKAGAWLDTISPITEWAGLKGDELRHKRELLRLEREASLVELGKKLKLRLEGREVTPIAPKVLIPSLERASLERPDSELLELWANLLAAEATDPADDTRTCASILGELGNIEAQILNTIKEKLVARGLWESKKVVERFSAARLFVREVYEQLSVLMRDGAKGSKSQEEAARDLVRVLGTSSCLGLRVDAPQEWPGRLFTFHTIR